MAQMPRFQDSTERLINVSRRHERLCSLNPDGEQLATAIHSKVEDLETKHQTTLKSKQQRENAYDDVSLCELNLENFIRTLFERCKQYDRDNPQASIVHKIFLEGKFRPYIDKSRETTLDEAMKLIMRLESLGAEHTLFPLAAQLREKIEKVRQALHKFYDASQIEKQALTTEQMAKDALRQQYEINYYESRKLFRKNYANRLFPQRRSPRRKKPAENTNTTPDATPPAVTP